MKKPRIFLYKLIFLISLNLGFLSTVYIHAQQNDLSAKAEELMYSNPDEAIKIAEHILNTTQIAEARARANLILGRSYLVKGDYNKSAISVFKDINQSPNVNLKTKIEVYLLESELLRVLYLDNQSQKCLFKAQSIVSQLSKSSMQDSLQCLIAIENIYMKLNRRENHEALKIINETNTRFKDFINNHAVENRKMTLAKEMAFRDLALHDSASIYINKVKFLLDPPIQNNLYEKSLVFSELGRLKMQEKAFPESEEALFIALKFAEIIDNPTLLMQINRELAINYLATNQKSKYKVYNDEFLVLNNNVELMEQKSINTIYNLITQQQENAVASAEKKYSNYQYMFLVGVLFVLLVGVFILLKSQARKKRLKEIIKYQEISRNYFEDSKTSKKTNTKRIIIPEDTEQTILLKLKRFENSRKFLNKDMSLAVLAGQFETNTKYLSEIINKHYNDNFNTFINKLRIGYIIDKLKKDSNYINYKISFLAEESGYSSHSSFATVFKTIICMSPATFINLIKEDREALKKHKKSDENKTGI